MITDLHVWQVFKVLTTALVCFEMAIGLAEDLKL